VLQESGILYSLPCVCVFLCLYIWNFMWAVHSSIFCCVYEFLNRLTLTHLYKRLMKIQRPILIQISQVS